MEMEMENRKRMVVWSCDVCKVAKFEDYQEACRHEQQCRAEGITVGGGGGGGEAIPSSRKRNNHSNSNNNNETATTEKAEQEEADPPKTKKQKSVPIASIFNTATRNKILKDSNTSLGQSNVNSTASASHNNNNKGKKEKQSTKTKKTTPPLAAIFQVHKKNKHDAVDRKAVVAKGLRTRQEAFASKTSTNNNMATATGLTGRPQQLEEKKNNPSKVSTTCPRFPVPSYIVPWSNSESTNSDSDPARKTLVSKDQLDKARDVLQKELPFPSKKPTLQFTDSEEEDHGWQWTYDHSVKQTQRLCPTRQDTEFDFAKQFSKLLKLTTKTTPRSFSCQTRLWGDASALINLQDICGAHNHQVANDLVAFVREWMVLRQGANERMAARQKALQNTKRTKKKKKKTSNKHYHDDDGDDEDLWFDSDNEEDGLPPRICLIEGPVGSCKSSLVHAVARHCDCQVVELNTSAKRGSVDLKKVLEEATTSHSSLAMFKNSQASLFSKQKKQQELVDSDSDSEEEKGSSEKKGCSLTVILIDEVDNIFETCGDAGFWSALNDLVQKAQCPIFLTANTTPKQLESMAYKYVVTSRPTPSECAEKMKQVLAREGVFTDRDDCDELMIGLASLAKLYGCDLRRILHRIQCLCSADIPVSGDNQKELPRPSHVMSREETPPVVEAITIEKVSPRTVSSETQTLLKIKGTNFDRLQHQTTKLGTSEVRVLVGGQLCPVARIVDDKTILAVCPPIVCDLGVDKFGMRNKTSYLRLESLDARFAPLSVQSVPPGGSLWVSTSNLFRNTLLDETVLGCVTPYNVERCFPEEDCSDVEFEDRNLASRPSCLLKAKCAARDQDEFNTADRLLRDELESTKSTGVGEEGTANVTSVGFGSSGDSNDKELETLADDLKLASDASLLDDYAGIPFLSGASLGFGYQFTPEGSGSQCSSSALKVHGNSTHCSEERLFSMGWKDTAAFYGDSDAWVSQPMLARDRKLVNAAVSSRLTHTASLKSLTGAAETIEYDLTLWSPPSNGNFEDDDCYLPRPIPTPLLSLSSLLLDYQKCKDLPTRDLNDDVLQRRKAVNIKDFLDASNIIFSRESQARMHWKGVVDPSPCADDCDTSFLLDYVPFLRSIAVLERTAHSIDDSGCLDVSRRRTRKSAKRGRSHYFESLNFLIRWGEEGAPSAVAAGDTFAKSLLTL